MTIRQMSNMSNAYRYLSVYGNQAQKINKQLSSGYRINSAADDAAGLAVSEKMRAQIGGLGKAYENAQAGVSMIQTAEGALQDSSDILTRMKELAVQSTNGTYSNADRALINQEFQSLKDELDRIAGATNYNGMNLLDGSAGSVTGQAGIEGMGLTSIDGTAWSGTGNVDFTFAQDSAGVWTITAESGGVTDSVTLNPSDTSASLTIGGDTVTLNFGSVSDLQQGTIKGVEMTPGVADVTNAVSTGTVNLQVGANGGEYIKVGIGDMSSAALGLDGVDITTAANANAALSAIEDAMNTVNDQRGSLGATQNRLEHTMSNLSNSKINLTAAESTIRDTDMAKSIMEYTQRRIQMQASQAMLSQGMNLSQQLMLGLLMR